MSFVPTTYRIRIDITPVDHKGEQCAESAAAEVLIARQEFERDFAKDMVESMTVGLLRTVRCQVLKDPA